MSTTDSDAGRIPAWVMTIFMMVVNGAAAIKADIRAKLRRDYRMAQRGQTSNLTNLVIGIMISGIVIMRVFIPVISDAASNLSGTEATIANLLPLFAVLLLLIALASPLMRRGG